MNKQEAYLKFLDRNEAHEADDPWQAVFEAGWDACMEAQKQTELFANEAQQVERHPCSVEVVGSSPSVGSITAEDIYAAYPRKVGKQAAIKAIIKAVKGHMGDERVSVSMGMAEMLRLTRAYAAATATWPAADKQFIPHPATWFNRGSYDDDPKEWVRGAAATPSQFRETK